MKRVISFRMDDITPKMVDLNFKLFVALFKKYQIKPLLGIVPDNQDKELNREKNNPNFWDMINDLKISGWSIAQHGYQHLYHTSEPGILGINKKSEFVGRAFSSQFNDILAGSKILAYKGLATDIWMAPAHSYDNRTLRALKIANFKYITDGYTLYPYIKSGLKFIPCQSSIPTNIPIGVQTVCIHSNTASKNYFDMLDKFISKTRHHCVSFSELLSLPADNRILNRTSEFIALKVRKVRNILK